MPFHYLFLLFCLFTQCYATFRFSTYFSNHVVLQKGYNRQYVWGLSSKIGDTVRLTITPNQGQGHIAGNATVNDKGVWMIKIMYNIRNNYGPYTLTATSSLGNASIHDVMFGDVWVCSGQSNMEFSVRGLQNATDELADTNGFQNVRIFRAQHWISNVSLEEFHALALPWSIPDQNTLQQFSAVCWLYGKYLSGHLNYPIGLVESNWGGTQIEAWSSTQALNSCPVNGKSTRLTRPTADTLWNAMIHPLLRTPIYGVVWYQGESNARHPDEYACQFPAMIRDWRRHFYIASNHATHLNFPFGFVQLAPNRNASVYLGFPGIRWSQTAAHGTVPNADMPNTFMAVAMDLPDYQSPRGSIHPRFKHDVAARLVLSSLAVAYHQKGFDFQGPYPSSYSLSSGALTIEYSHGREPIDVRSHDGFEICCSTTRSNCSTSAGLWKPSPVTSFDSSTVTLDTTDCHGVGPVSAVRYAWKESPCEFKHCPIYGRDNDLPGPPFYHHF